MQNLDRGKLTTLTVACMSNAGMTIRRYLCACGASSKQDRDRCTHIEVGRRGRE